jgi:hypothetical protein
MAPAILTWEIKYRPEGLDGFFLFKIEQKLSWEHSSLHCFAQALGNGFLWLTG